MSCLVAIFPFLVVVVIVCAAVAIARLLLARAAVDPLVLQILSIFLWAVVTIACLYLVYDLLMCALPLARMR